jgi:hypothetical protein
MADMQSAGPSSRYEMRFDSLLEQGSGKVFPCDERGLVTLDELSERGRNNYLYARAMRGRQFDAPRIVPCRDARR